MKLVLTEEEKTKLDTHLKMAEGNLSKQLDQLKVVENLLAEVRLIQSQFAFEKMQSDSSFEIDEKTRLYLLKFVRSMPLEKVESLFLKLIA